MLPRFLGHCTAHLDIAQSERTPAYEEIAYSNLLLVGQAKSALVPWLLSRTMRNGMMLVEKL